MNPSSLLLTKTAFANIVGEINHTHIDVDFSAIEISVVGKDAATGLALLSIKHGDKERRLTQEAAGRLLKLLDASAKALGEFSDATDKLNLLLSFSKGKRNGSIVRLSVTRDVITDVSKPAKKGITLTSAWNGITILDCVASIRQIDCMPNDQFGIRLLYEASTSPETNPSDVNYAGAYVYVGTSVTVSPMIYNLSRDSMFMLTNDGSGIKITDKDVADSIPKTVTAISLSSKELLREYVKSAKVEVTSPVDYVNRILRVVGLRGKLRQDIVDLAQSGLPKVKPSIYDVIQLIAGFSKTLPEKRCMKVQQSAGDVLSVHSGSMSCPQCGVHV